MGARGGIRSGVDRWWPAFAAALALAAVLALAGAPTADSREPLELRNASGGPLHGPYQHWARGARVPLPAGKVRVSLSGCPGRPDLVACVKVRHPRVIYLRRSGPRQRSVLLHELGHVFDLTTMRARDRMAFKRVHGRLGTRWWAGPSPPGEWFAEAYSLCARYGPRLPADAATTYGYRPSVRRHRRSCRVIRKAGADPRPRRPRPKHPQAPPTLTEPAQTPQPISSPPPPPPPPRDCILLILCDPDSLTS